MASSYWTKINRYFLKFSLMKEIDTYVFIGQHMLFWYVFLWKKSLVFWRSLLFLWDIYCFLNKTFWIRVDILVDWLSPKAEDPILSCYLTLSWGEKRWIHNFCYIICTKVKLMEFNWKLNWSCWFFSSVL